MKKKPKNIIISGSNSGLGLFLSKKFILDGHNLILLSRKNNKKKLSIEKDLKGLGKNKSELSILVAEKLAKKALEKNIKKIYFDRGKFKYHGRVKTFAETLRKKGLEF